MHTLTVNVTATYHLYGAAKLQIRHMNTQAYADCTNSDPLFWALSDYLTIEFICACGGLGGGQRDELKALLSLCIFLQRHEQKHMKVTSAPAAQTLAE